MARTRNPSAAAAAVKGAAGKKKKGNTSAAPAAAKKRKTRSTKTIASDAVEEEPDDAVPADVAPNEQNETTAETAILAVDAGAKSATAITSPDAGGARDSVVASPRRGKKQKQSSLNASSPPLPKPKYCCWSHCPFPHIGVMTKTCSTDGCGATMHEQCLYDFENDIGYNTQRGKVEDTYYCPNHHPRKDDIEDDYISDDNDKDKNEDTVSPVKNSHATIPAPPPLPKPPTDCDWNLCPTGCVLFTRPTIPCQRDGCTRKVHHLCALEWEQSKGIEAPTISSYCRYHHPIFPMMNQLQQIPTGGDLSSSDSSDIEDEGGKDNNDNEVQDKDDIEETSDPEIDSNNSKEEEAVDSDGCDDGNDSGDDGSEAEIHDAGAEFEENENTIDNLYGVDFVPSLPGAKRIGNLLDHLRTGCTKCRREHRWKMILTTLVIGTFSLLHPDSTLVKNRRPFHSSGCQSSSKK